MQAQGSFSIGRVILRFAENTMGRIIDVAMDFDEGDFFRVRQLHGFHAIDNLHTRNLVGVENLLQYAIIVGRDQGVREQFRYAESDRLDLSTLAEYVPNLLGKNVKPMVVLDVGDDFP